MAMLLDGFWAPPVPEIVLPRADGDDPATAPAVAIGLGVQEDHVQAARDLVPPRQHRDEFAELRDRDEVAVSLSGAPALEPDLVTARREEAAMITLPIVL